MNHSTGLNINFEWERPGTAKGDELRATWASLSITSNGKPITEVLDTQTNSRRSVIYLPLYPLAEWLAENWWFIEAETEKPGDPGYDSRHNMRHAREGYVLPSLELIPLGNTLMSLQWNRHEYPSAGIRFITEDRKTLAAHEVLHPLRSLIHAVIYRLEEHGITATPLHEQWNSIHASSREDREFSYAAARMGLDPFSAEDSVADTIVKAAGQVKNELHGDLFSLASPSSLESIASSLEVATERIAEDESESDGLDYLRQCRVEHGVHSTPWAVGYHLANQVRKVTGIKWKSRKLEELAEHLRIKRIDDCIIERGNLYKGIEAFSGCNSKHKPRFIVNKSWPDSQQFAFCRAIFDQLSLPEGQFAAVSALRSERQQMNRAFAAELLAPHQVLKSQLASNWVTQDEIIDLARDFGVSDFVVRNQIINHKLAQVEDENIVR
jgi:Zn-dependent peptidase ImmA (M78 family)